jgi:hypothetical protein
MEVEVDPDFLLDSRFVVLQFMWRPYYQKPRLDSSALAFQILSWAKAVTGLSPLARLGLAYFGLAWLGSQPEAGPSTALDMLCKIDKLNPFCPNYGYGLDYYEMDNMQEVKEQVVDFP